MGTTDDSQSVSSTSSRDTVVNTNPNDHISSNDNKGSNNDDSLLKYSSHFTEPMEANDDLLNGDQKRGKRSSDDTNTELQTDQAPRLRRPRRSSDTSCSDVLVSSLTKRLNKMTVKDRQNAMYDIHGIPLDDEYCDNGMVIKADTIERDPQKLHELLLEQDRMIEERIQFSKSSYKEGENFGEPHLFPLLTPEQQHELMMPPTKIPIATNNNAVDNSTQNMDNSHVPAAAAASVDPNYKHCIQQRIQFLKHELDDEEFGEGLRLARQQNPQFVYAQRIKFLRANRYDVNLASARMIRFFDIKRELFCAPGYNEKDDTDRMDCLGRDLRLSDFSKEDLELWKNTGFLQLCGMRDRANRAIVMTFGKVISEAKIPVSLVLRVYLFVFDLLSRDKSTQLAGVVLIAYSMFLNTSSSRKVSSPPVRSTKKGSGIGFDDRELDSNINEEAVEQYLKLSYPLLSQIVKVGMSAQLRSVAKHFCIDHPKLLAQVEKLAGYVSTYGAARFRCHYANAQNPESSILRASGSAKSITTGNSPNADSATSDRSYNTSISNSNINHDAEAEADTPQAQPYKPKSDNDNAIGSDVNPHKEVMYTLMTFGIPRETIPVNDATGEIDLEFHKAVLDAIEAREQQDRLLEVAAASSTSANSSAALAPTGSGSNAAAVGKQLRGNKPSKSLVSNTSSNKLWMSLTVSTSSNKSFALFPNFLEEQEIEGESNNSTTSLFESSPMAKPESLQKMEHILPDVLTSSLISLSTDNARSASKPAAAANEIPRQAEKPALLPEAPTIVPTSNDIKMGRGPWNRDHPGNLQLKDMLERERNLYERVNRYERMRIVDSMLNELHDEHGARFLYKPKTSKAKKPDETAVPRQTPVSMTDDVWLEAKRDKAHNKITHDFRNLRRQKDVSPKPYQAHSQAFSGYDI